MNNLKQYFLGGLVFSGTVIISFIGFAAYTSLPTQGDGATITQTIWNDVINKINTIGTKVDTLSNVPTGAIMAFNLSTCPDGWIAANGSNGTPDLRGEFIRGLDSGRGVDSGRILASWQNYDWKGFYQTDTLKEVNTGYSHDNVYMGKSTTNYIGNLFGGGWTSPSARIGTQWDTSEPRPRNVAFLYCIKN